jgi:histidine triad (HIT) family protein
MEIPKEKIEEIKKQLINQINSTFPEDKKTESIQQIESMNDSQFLEFLQKNNLIREEGGPSENQCIFCSIIFGDVPSTKIGENEKAISILEINPISEGHSLIIPKNHVEKEEDLDEDTERLAKEVSDVIKEAFNPSEIKILPGNVMGHEILNVLPIYKDETIESPRMKKSPEELKDLQEKILSYVKEEPQNNFSKKIEQINAKDIWLPRRVP